MSKCLWSGGSGSEELKEYPPPFPTVLKENPDRKKKKALVMCYGKKTKKKQNIKT